MSAIPVVAEVKGAGQKLMFNRTFTLDSIIVILTIIVTMAITWGSVSNRLSNVEDLVKNDREIMTEMRISNAQLVELVKAMDRRTTRLEDYETVTCKIGCK